MGVRAPGGLSFRSRARRGTSGALNLQSAIAGLNPLPRSPFSNAARRVTLRTGSRAAANREPCQIRKEAALSDHRRVPRNGLVRAARHGGHEQRPGRRRVHGNNQRPSAQTGGGRDDDRPASGSLSSLACPDLRRDRRPGGRRRDAAQCRPSRAGQSCRPVRRTARHGQDVARPDPGQGRQLHQPPGRRRLRRVPVLHLDPRGHDPGPDRDRRREQPWHRRRSQPARAPAVPTGPAPTQDLHPRRGASDHQGRMERAPQVDRGAARLRDLHVRIDRAVALPAGDPVAPPALRRAAPDRRGDRGQADAHPHRRRAGGRPGRDPSHRAACRRRHARRRIDARPAAVRRAGPHR